jgi:hypothetical protein
MCVLKHTDHHHNKKMAEGELSLNILGRRGGKCYSMGLVLLWVSPCAELLSGTASSTPDSPSHCLISEQSHCIDQNDPVCLQSMPCVCVSGGGRDCGTPHHGFILTQQS